MTIASDSEAYVVGETVELGGGRYSSSGTVEFEVPEKCSDVTEIYVVNGLG